MLLTYTDIMECAEYSPTITMDSSSMVETADIGGGGGRQIDEAGEGVLSLTVSET
jgi:hypothetical protein